jgi:glutamate-1-semialdehyde 2,1-aminomutase
MRERVPLDATPVPPDRGPNHHFEVAVSADPAASAAPVIPRDRQTVLYQRALQTLPGGTNSNFRAWGDDTVYIDRGKGGRVWDADGNEFIDLRMGYGPVILGHGDDRVDDYVNERMRRGVSFSLTSDDEIRAMELVKELTGWVDKARMTVSGTEATMHAMRIARAFTGRDKIVKFEGQYHGVHDYALISVSPDNMSELGDEDNPVRLTWGRGIPSPVADTIIPARYNNIEFLRRLFERQGEEIAAIIVEPVLGNAQAIMPKPGFHQAMRALTEEFGILLIFDEVKTGFRLARGGAAEFFGIKPDLATYAKAMGNGYPAAAFGGREEVMSVLPDKVSHGGTYAGNRVAAAATVKTLEILRDSEALDVIHAVGRRLQDGLREILNPTGLPYVFTGHPSMFGIMFTDKEPSEYRDWANTDHELYDAIAVGMHARGAMPEPDSREPWFICEAHAEGDIVDRVLTSFEDSLGAALEDRANRRPAAQGSGAMAHPSAG